MDVKYLITVDADGAIKSTQVFDGTLNNLAGQSDKTEKAHKGLWKEVALGQFAYNAAVKAGKFFLDFLKDSFKEAENAEKVNRALTSSLEITGRNLPGLADHFKAYAGALQSSTIYSDDSIQTAQNLLIQLTNLDRDGLDKATRGTIGLASVMGMDLESAAQLVAKSMTGNMGLMGRYGIRVDETKTKEGQRAELLGKLENFYKRATDQTETYGGKLFQLKNLYAEIQESVGQYIIKNTNLVGALKDVVIIMNVLVGGQDKEIESNQRLIENGKQRVELLLRAGMAANLDYNSIMNLIAAYNGNTSALMLSIKTGKEGLLLQNALSKAQKDRVAALMATSAAELAASKGTNAFTDATADAAAATKKQKESLDKAKKAIDDYAKSSKETDKIIDALKTSEFEFITTFNMGTTITDKNTFALNQNVTELKLVASQSTTTAKTVKKSMQEMLDSAINTANNFMGAFSTAYGFITASAQQSFTNRGIMMENDYQTQLAYINNSTMNETQKNEAIAALDSEYDKKRKALEKDKAEQQKKMSVVQAIISTFQAVAQTFSTFGFPWGVIPAGIMLGLGLDLIAKIKAQPIPLAKGAIFKQPTFLQSPKGQDYHVAEGPDGAEIISNSKQLREAILGKNNKQGGKNIILNMPIMIGGKKVSNVILKMVEDGSRLGGMRISAKAIA